MFYKEINVSKAIHAFSLFDIFYCVEVELDLHQLWLLQGGHGHIIVLGVEGGKGEEDGRDDDYSHPT